VAVAEPVAGVEPAAGVAVDGLEGEAFDPPVPVAAAAAGGGAAAAPAPARLRERKSIRAACAALCSW
jgi:hypothetical protein